jgi:hypothetical protein
MVLNIDQYVVGFEFLFVFHEMQFEWKDVELESLLVAV